jgi:hypothetical protein
MCHKLVALGHALDFGFHRAGIGIDIDFGHAKF